MFMLMLYRYITGYVKFCGTGTFPERFLNLCAKQNIIIWNPRINLGKLSGYMRVKDYRNIRPIAKKSGMKLKIYKKYGVVFIINRYRKRSGIALGAALFFVIIWFLSGFCMNISICGNQKFSDEYIISKLKSQGVCIGKRMSSIEPEKARQEFLISNPEFSWTALNKRGSFITVEIRETTEKKMNTTIKYPCNIVAKRGGKILRVKAYEGSISVMVDEAVASGDLLVSGVIELSNKATKFVSANAEVIAQTTRTLKVFVPYEQTIYINTGKKLTHSVLNIAGIDLPLFLGEAKAPYKVKRTTKYYEMWGVKLPFYKTSAAFTLTEAKKITIDKNTAQKLAREKMDNKAKEKLSKILKYGDKSRFEYTKKGVYMEKDFVCEENIAKVKKILK